MERFMHILLRTRLRRTKDKNWQEWTQLNVNVRRKLNEKMCEDRSWRDAVGTIQTDNRHE
jgi:hypothetical protein